MESREFASKAQPGQFAHLLVPGKTLRRPISICDADPEEGTLRLVFQVRGEGTELLSQFEEGQTVDILAPLGHGFTAGDPSRRAVLVGGGIGVPPLLMAAKPFGKNATVILGFRSRDAVILKEDFEKAGCRVILCTDDGSAGFRGLVTEPLRKVLEEPKDVVLACGPGPMLKGVAEEAEATGRTLPDFPGGTDGMRCGSMPGVRLQNQKSGRGRGLSPRLQGRSCVQC